MASEYCPKCRQLRDCKITVCSRKEKTVDGKIKRIKTESYHCEVCGSFVRSEETEESEAGCT